jgi:putative endonuclease
MATPSLWYVYMLHCSDGTLYTGVTTDLERRLREHNRGPRGARYTRARRPVTLAYHEVAASRAAACRREWELRQLSRGQKQALVSSRATDSG